MINFSVMRYLNQVRRLLPCSGKMKKQIFAQVRKNVSDHVVENPSADYEALTKRFGTPAQIACAFVDMQGTQDLLKSLRIKRKVIGIIAATALAACVMWAGVIGAAIVDLFDSTHGLTYVYIDSAE